MPKPSSRPRAKRARSEPLAVEYRPISLLKPKPENPRSHSPKQIEQIARSLQSFGFVNPILIDRAGRIIAGHGRIEAARLLGFEEIPTICLEHMTEAQKRAYAIADNRLAELAGWDRELLRVELAYVAELEIEFDLTLTGFETAEIDLMLDPEGTSSETAALDRCPPPEPDRPAVSRVGDLWQLGRHRLLCADATQIEHFDQLLGARLADLVFTDPPYNVPVDGHARGRGRTRHREFMMAAGEMSEAEFTKFLSTVLRNLVNHSRLGSIHFICMDWRHIAELLAAAQDLYAEVKNLCVWVKPNAGMGSLYRSQHELVLVLKNGKAPHVNNVELGRIGRYRTNVWNYPGVNSWGPGRAEALILHPTVKPVALIADAIRDCSKRHAIVLDPFVGSGTTLLAAERTQRTAYAMEIDPHYVDVAIRRFQKATGQTAVHVGTGLEFEAMREQRLSATIPDGVERPQGRGEEK
jgi:DNA modification methylase